MGREQERRKGKLRWGYKINEINLIVKKKKVTYIYTWDRKNKLPLYMHINFYSISPKKRKGKILSSLAEPLKCSGHHESATKDGFAQTVGSKFKFQLPVTLSGCVSLGRLRGHPLPPSTHLRMG